MKVVTTNKLNRFWKKGIKPVIDSIADKFDKAKLANNCLTTEEGFALDARQGTALQGEIDEIYSNLSSLFVEVSGTSPRTNITALELKTFQITFPIPDGYQFHSVKNFYISGWSGLVLQGISTSGNNVVFSIYNTREATRECVVTAVINCIKINI